MCMWLAPTAFWEVHFWKSYSYLVLNWPQSMKGWQQYCVHAGKSSFNGADSCHRLAMGARKQQSYYLEDTRAASEWVSWPSALPITTWVVKSLKQAAVRGNQDIFSCHLQPSSHMKQTFPAAVRQEGHCPARISFLRRTSHALGVGPICHSSSLSRCGTVLGWESRERSHTGLGCFPEAPIIFPRKA